VLFFRDYNGDAPKTVNSNLLTQLGKTLRNTIVIKIPTSSVCTVFYKRHPTAVLLDSNYVFCFIDKNGIKVF